MRQYDRYTYLSIVNIWCNLLRLNLFVQLKAHSGEICNDSDVGKSNIQLCPCIDHEIFKDTLDLNEQFIPKDKDIRGVNRIVTLTKKPICEDTTVSLTGSSKTGTVDLYK